MVELERDLRGVQSVFLFGILAVVFHYGISMGRNMKGMILGYGLYVGSSLITLATQSYAVTYAGTSFYEIWKIVQPLSWNVSLVIWTFALWSFYPNPAPKPTIRLEEDYEVFASKTRSYCGLDAVLSREVAAAVIQLILFLVIGIGLFCSLYFLARRRHHSERDTEALLEARTALTTLPEWVCFTRK